MTLKEIAKMVGVSPSTVSRVINKNDEKCASQEVKNKIWKIVQETGYTPNKSAQQLKLASNPELERENVKRLACVFARVKDVNDQFFSALYRVIEQEAFKNQLLMQYAVTFSQLEGQSGQKMLKDIEADGAIILGRCDKQLMQRIKDSCRHVICTSLNPVDFPIDQVICDGYKAAKEAVNYLYKLGHRKIGYIGELNNEMRYKGYFSQMQELGLDVDRSFIASVSHSMEGGYRGAQEIISKPKHPTAIFCCNDITAVGAISAIKAKKLNIPNEISIISIDNIEMAKYVSPMLTTVGVPLEEMGKMTVTLLRDRMNGGHSLPMKMEMPFGIIKRESCKQLRR